MRSSRRPWPATWRVPRSGTTMPTRPAPWATPAVWRPAPPRPRRGGPPITIRLLLFSSLDVALAVPGPDLLSIGPEAHEVMMDLLCQPDFPAVGFACLDAVPERHHVADQGALAFTSHPALNGAYDAQT